MSLDEGLNVNLKETVADGNQIQSAVPGKESMRAKSSRWSQSKIQFTW